MPEGPGGGAAVVVDGSGSGGSVGPGFEAPLQENTEVPVGQKVGVLVRSRLQPWRRTRDFVRGEGLVDVDPHAGVGARVCAGEVDRRGLLATAAADLELSTLHLSDRKGALALDMLSQGMKTYIELSARVTLCPMEG